MRVQHELLPGMGYKVLIGYNVLRVSVPLHSCVIVQRELGVAQRAEFACDCSMSWLQVGRRDRRRGAVEHQGPLTDEWQEDVYGGWDMGCSSRARTPYDAVTEERHSRKTPARSPATVACGAVFHAQRRVTRLASCPCPRWGNCCGSCPTLSCGCVCWWRCGQPFG